jgi:hypothetical protein
MKVFVLLFLIGPFTQLIFGLSLNTILDSSKNESIIASSVEAKNAQNSSAILLSEAGFVSEFSHGEVASSNVTIFYDTTEAPIKFAAQDLKNILDKKGANATLSPLSKLTDKPAGTYVVIAKDEASIRTKLLAAGGKNIETKKEQGYALRVTKTNESIGYWVLGGDRVGAMYGGIHLGEIAKAGSLADVKDEEHSPYIAKRGLKFNIPLDIRQPSHGENWSESTSPQTNIEHMWDINFWTEYLDVLARQRYNVLSLWNKHPFPSLVKLDDYPDVALDDVYNVYGKVKNMPHAEKIALWQKIMELAWERGIEVYIITWNIHMNGTDGKYGITEKYDNKTTVGYLRKSVKQAFITYPRLAGIGVTAGENMDGIDDDTKEQWLWETYGMGVQDAKKEQPDRFIRFIHRDWMTSFDKISSRFGQLDDGFDMENKYIKARIYSYPTAKFAENDILKRIPADKSTWWNIRNDDIYNLRWGDPEYVKQFILNFPKGSLTAGYMMGSDRYAWGRESISKNPLFPRQLENEKHWYSFLLWGRLGYDPNTPAELLKGLINDRFPSVSVPNLFEAWQAASRTLPLVNQIHWYDWDYKWWVEGCSSSGVVNSIKGFHDVNSFIKGKAMPHSGVISISDFVDGKTEGKSPLEVANAIEGFANEALIKISGLTDSGNTELRETIGDIRAQAYLGLYYASKIRGAVELARYRKSGDTNQRSAAVIHLEKALIHWQNYAATLDAQYNKMVICFNGLFDWHARTEDVRNDISIAGK